MDKLYGGSKRNCEPETGLCIMRKKTKQKTSMYLTSKMKIATIIKRFLRLIATKHRKKIESFPSIEYPIYKLFVLFDIIECK